MIFMFHVLSSDDTLIHTFHFCGLIVCSLVIISNKYIFLAYKLFLCFDHFDVTSTNKKICHKKYHDISNWWIIKLSQPLFLKLALWVKSVDRNEFDICAFFDLQKLSIHLNVYISLQLSIESIVGQIVLYFFLIIYFLVCIVHSPVIKQWLIFLL